MSLVSQNTIRTKTPMSINLVLFALALLCIQPQPCRATNFGSEIKVAAPSMCNVAALNEWFGDINSFLEHFTPSARRSSHAKDIRIGESKAIGGLGVVARAAADTMKTIRDKDLLFSIIRDKDLLFSIPLILTQSVDALSATVGTPTVDSRVTQGRRHLRPHGAVLSPLIASGRMSPTVGLAISLMVEMYIDAVSQNTAHHQLHSPLGPWLRCLPSPQELPHLHLWPQWSSERSPSTTLERDVQRIIENVAEPVSFSQARSSKRVTSKPPDRNLFAFISDKRREMQREFATAMNVRVDTPATLLRPGESSISLQTALERFLPVYMQCLHTETETTVDAGTSTSNNPFRKCSGTLNVQQDAPSSSSSATFPSIRSFFTSERYHHVQTLFESRAWNMMGKQYLVPIADFFNHRPTPSESAGFQGDQPHRLTTHNHVDVSLKEAPKGHFLMDRQRFFARSQEFLAHHRITKVSSTRQDPSQQQSIFRGGTSLAVRLFLDFALDDSATISPADTLDVISDRQFVIHANTETEEEIFESYGDNSNDIYFKYHGFSPDNNLFESVEIGHCSAFFRQQCANAKGSVSPAAAQLNSDLERATGGLQLFHPLAYLTTQKRLHKASLSLSKGKHNEETPPRGGSSSDTKETPTAPQPVTGALDPMLLLLTAALVSVHPPKESAPSLSLRDSGLVKRFQPDFSSGGGEAALLTALVSAAEHDLEQCWHRHVASAARSIASVADAHHLYHRWTATCLQGPATTAFAALKGNLSKAFFQKVISSPPALDESAAFQTLRNWVTTSVHWLQYTALRKMLLFHFKGMFRSSNCTADALRLESLAREEDGSGGSVAARVERSLLQYRLGKKQIFKQHLLLIAQKTAALEALLVSRTQKLVDMLSQLAQQTSSTSTSDHLQGDDDEL